MGTVEVTRNILTVPVHLHRRYNIGVICVTESTFAIQNLASSVDLMALGRQNFQSSTSSCFVHHIDYAVFRSPDYMLREVLGYCHVTEFQYDQHNEYVSEKK